MKYFLQFEGNEKLIVKLILIFLLITTIFLGRLAFKERPIDVVFPSEELIELCQKLEQNE